MKKIIYFSRFAINADGNGGERRTFQIYTVLKELKTEFINITQPQRTKVNKLGEKLFTKLLALLSKIKVYNLISEYFLSDGELYLWNKDIREPVAHLRACARKWAKKVKLNKDIKLAIVDDPIFFKALVRQLKQSGIPIVATCQNIESLVGGQVTQKKQRVLFNKEITILSKCDLVVTISREDTLLLNNCGINTLYYSYYPPHNVLNRFLKIRDKRKITSKKDFILLGTASNVPTREGVIKLTKLWKKLNFQDSGNKLMIVGFDTDLFKDNVIDDNIEVLGYLSNEELDEKLSTVKACVCYQMKASGVLVRITELLIAGVPIIANTIAARSYYNRNGVIEFSCVEDLKKILVRPDRYQQEMPLTIEPPDNSVLLAKVSNLCRNRD